MKKQTNWDGYFRDQMADATTRRLVEEELKALRIGVQLARLRQAMNQVNHVEPTGEEQF